MRETRKEEGRRKERVERFEDDEYGLGRVWRTYEMAKTSGRIKLDSEEYYSHATFRGSDWVVLFMEDGINRIHTMTIGEAEERGIVRLVKGRR